MEMSSDQQPKNARFQWERYTERARLVVHLSQEEAAALQHDRIESSHILLGLLREREGLAGQALDEAGIGLDAAREKAKRIVRPGGLPRFGSKLPFSERTESILESAVRISKLGSLNYLGTEHLLLALLADEDCDAMTLMRELGSPERVLANLNARRGKRKPPRLFLCHSSADKAAIRKLYKQLRDDGARPWFDEEDLLPGQDWDWAIRRAVRNADCVVVCLSEASVTRAGYVHREIKEALDVADEQPEGAIFVIPARLEECEVPERLRHLHWVDLFSEGGYQRLLRAAGVG